MSDVTQKELEEDPEVLDKVSGVEYYPDDYESPEEVVSYGLVLRVFLTEEPDKNPIITIFSGVSALLDYLASSPLNLELSEEDIEELNLNFSTPDFTRVIDYEDLTLAIQTALFNPVDAMPSFVGEESTYESDDDDDDDDDNDNDDLLEDD